MLLLNTINQKVIKESNRTRILKLIRDKEEITIKDIAKILGISIPTVISNVNHLLDEKLVIEDGVAQSTGGRKPVIIKFDPLARMSIGVDISPNKISIAIIDMNANIIAEDFWKVDKKFSFHKMLEKVKELIDAMITKENLDHTKLLGIGFSLPGLVNEETLVLENAPNLKVKSFDFKSYEAFFGLPIYLENEANAAAIGESQLGSLSKTSNLVFISITEGIGTGIIIQNYLYKSGNKRAGEFGHMRISDESIHCNCGRTGCWELFASESALLERYNQQAEKNIESVEALMNKVREKDDIATGVLQVYLKYLAIGIDNIIMALSPESIVIGGEISKYHTLYESMLVEYLNRESELFALDDSIITYSILNGKASILGAGLMPIYELITTGRTTL